MGAASKGGIVCGKCGNSRRRYAQIKGGIEICRECNETDMAAENAELRREIHELKTQLARMKRDGCTEEFKIEKRVITPPEQRWDGYGH
jgi:hypothetical protein